MAIYRKSFGFTVSVNTYVCHVPILFLFLFLFLFICAAICMYFTFYRGAKLNLLLLYSYYFEQIKAFVLIYCEHFLVWSCSHGSSLFDVWVFQIILYITWYRVRIYICRLRVHITAVPVCYTRSLSALLTINALRYSDLPHICSCRCISHAGTLRQEVRNVYGEVLWFTPSFGFSSSHNPLRGQASQQFMSTAFNVIPIHTYIHTYKNK